MSEARSVLGLAVAIAIAVVPACDSGGGESTTGTGTDATTEAVPPPGDIEGRAHRLTVRLSWSPPPESGSVGGYGIYRNGSLLQGVTGDRTTFTDEDVKPERTYSYEVRARVGGEVSEPAAVEVEVPRLPLEAARLVGDFAVTARVISHTGYADFEAPTFGWHFTPRCRAGACDVEWQDLGPGRIRAKLQRKGPRYAGEYSGPYLVKCGQNTTTSSVTLDLKVEKAKPVAGDWRATKVVGTLRNSEPPQLGCMASSAYLEVTAKLTSAG